MKPMLFSFLFLLSCGSHVVSGVDRDPQILNVIGKHSESVANAVSLVRGAMHSELFVFNPPFCIKQPGGNVPARESTMVDASLSMAHAVRRGLQLDFPARVSKVDVVLQALVPVIASAGGSIVGRRESARVALGAASQLVSGLNRDLGALVSDFAKPISRHVNFALFEVLVQATEWPFSALVDTLIRGFQPVGVVPCTGCLRPVREAAVSEPSKESNLQSFADAVEHLSRKARSASGNAAAPSS